MSKRTADPELDIERRQHVAIVEMRRPPHNYFDLPFLTRLAQTLEALDRDPTVRATVLCAQGAAFSAGANLVDPRSVPRPESEKTVNPLYAQSVRLFALNKPMVAAVHGAAVGGGLGLALVADFRVSCAEARFSANFARLGITPGFGLTATLPRLVGAQRAASLFYNGRRIGGQEALDIGLVDALAPQASVREQAIEQATEIATSSPAVVGALRAVVRAGLVDAVRLAVARESAQQYHQFITEDFREGVAAMAERRPPRFQGH
ncbi:enoyl-CoA hydratase/isomerase family protein [Rhodoferax sediminis]|uniref:Enoyl-CoA hydratase/isomerase family protein n=1 Tax=Rhodoferax sediminis TaxID=2509614 RepID=A0A515D9Z3_9BURK|nr:enoyl-CoA hydratase/isomerase family protein [Rhodoferax sediminis]QDL37231.1 enoyl-CoA hydratase/isomerase family protein [Rhodoferax sediminis]